jgi:hypothetical protein
MTHLTPDAENVADVLLINLEGILGTLAFDAIVEKISEDYLGNKMDICATIIRRPDLFERALIAILGEIGGRILAYIWCSKLCKQLNLGSALTYQKAGDLTKCIESVLANKTDRNPT